MPNWNRAGCALAPPGVLAALEAAPLTAPDLPSMPRLSCLGSHKQPSRLVVNMHMRKHIQLWHTQLWHTTPNRSTPPNPRPNKNEEKSASLLQSIISSMTRTMRFDVI